MLFAIAVILILIADQGLKYWVTLHIPLDEGVRALLPRVLELRNIHNTGAAFSLLSNAPHWVFILLAVAFIAIIILAVRKQWVHGAFGRWMAILLLAGALGNCLDRMLSGYVVDMLAFEFWPSFPVFNIADVCIVVGAIGFILHMLLYQEPETAGKKPEQTAKESGKERAGKPAAPAAQERAEVLKARAQREKIAERQPVAENQATQRVDVSPRPEAARTETARPAAPKAAAMQPVRPDRPAVEEVPASEDPFAAWDHAVQTLAQEAKAKAAAKPAPEPVFEPKPSDVKPTVERPRKPESDSFSLEDILAEFKD